MPGFGGLFQSSSEQRTRIQEQQIGQVTGGLAASGGGTQALGGMAVSQGRGSRTDINVTTLDVEAIEAMENVALSTLASQQSVVSGAQGQVSDVLASLEQAQRANALAASQSQQLAETVAGLSPVAQQSLTTKTVAWALVGILGLAGVVAVVYAVKMKP